MLIFQTPFDDIGTEYCYRFQSSAESIADPLDMRAVEKDSEFGGELKGGQCETDHVLSSALLHGTKSISHLDTFYEWARFFSSLDAMFQAAFKNPVTSKDIEC
jgi:hypothetical protein